MKISIISPPWIAVPPVGYGGIELITYHLAEGLTQLGNEVFLFAPKGSEVSCGLKPYIETTANFGLNSPLDVKRMVQELSSKYAYAASAEAGVEVIHDHSLFNYPSKLPVLHTLHGPANNLTVGKCVEISQNSNNHFVSISKRQQQLHLELNKNINFIGNIYNCVDVNKYQWSKNKEDYFLFIGRANWEKGLDLAIRVAAKAEVNLIMAVKMSEDFEREFFKKEIQPWIDKYPKNRKVELMEEIPFSKKNDLYKNAKCVLFTSQWEEPFGLVMTEAMASGTPVLALSCGAAPEVIVDGKTGFVVKDEEAMIEAVKKIGSINPEDCRKHTEENFSREKICRDYVEVYKKII